MSKDLEQFKSQQEFDELEKSAYTKPQITETQDNVPPATNIAIFNPKNLKSRFVRKFNAKPNFWLTKFGKSKNNHRPQKNLLPSLRILTVASFSISLVFLAVAIFIFGLLNWSN